MESKKTKKKTARKFYHFTKLLLRNYPAVGYIIKWSIISIVISIAIGSASALFLYSLEKVTLFRESHSYIILLLPLAGFLIGLLYHYYGKDSNAGNNLLIDTIHKPEKRIPFRMAPFIFVSTIVTHLFGGSAGREGTAIQMACSIGDWFRKPFSSSRHDTQILLIAATAAGFGSVFGTPLAGAIFGLEFYLIGRIRYNALYPAFISAIIADLITKSWGINHTHYSIPFIPEVSFQNIGYILLAGVAFGLCAVSFSKGLHLSSNIFKKRISYPPLRPVLGGFIVIVGIWILGTTKYIGLGIPSLMESFQTQSIPYAFALKILFTIVTLSSGFKGGEVTPLFFIGATLGSALSFIIPLPVALLAGMGFVAVFAGATNTPLASSIMAIEMFGSECGIYVAIACIVSFLISGHTSIYGRQLIGEPKFKKYDLEKDLHINDIKRHLF